MQSKGLPERFLQSLDISGTQRALVILPIDGKRWIGVFTYCGEAEQNSMASRLGMAGCQCTDHRPQTFQGPGNSCSWQLQGAGFK